MPRLSVPRFKPPIAIGITTLPSRIALMRPCLESLLNGTRTPDRIVLTLPQTLLREPAGYDIPDFVTDRSWHGGIVEIVRPVRDCGPGAKLLGALSAIAEPSFLLLADDDVRYRPDFVARFATAFAGTPDRALSGYTYRCNGLTIGQGCDGFGLWSPWLAEAQAFFDKHVAGTRFVFHDDLWISFLLAMQGIRLSQLPASAEPGYEQVHQVAALSRLDGELGPIELTRDGIDHLIASVEMSPARRARMKIARQGGRYLGRTARRVARRLGLRVQRD